MILKVWGRVVPTTTREFQLLDYLARHAGRTFTRGELLDAVWVDGFFVTPRSVDVYLRRLREKIEPDPDNPSYIKHCANMATVLMRLSDLAKQAR